MEDFLKLVGVLLTTTCGLDPRHLYRENYASVLRSGDSFDFIVVGSGPAGAAIASRLAENLKWRILLVEAGDYPNIASEIPNSPVAQDADFDWKYKTEPLKNAALALNEHRVNMARGKCLGGSTTVNGMLYTRGLENDYNWQSFSNPSWSWKFLEPYFKKLEKLENSNNEHYGKNGRVSLNLIEAKSGFGKYFMDAAKGLGYNVSSNEESGAGFFTVPMTISSGKRCSSAKAYLNKLKYKQANIYFALNTLVTKVIFKKQSAAGVEIFHNGKKLQIRATREVILSAGVFGSPQLLMLSGIGPENHLKSLNIPVRSNLQVGENFQDHSSTLVFFVKLNPLKSPDLYLEAINYCLYNNGTFSIPRNLNFIWSINSAPNKPEPDAQVQFSYSPKGDDFNVLPYIGDVNTSIVKSPEGLTKSHDVLSITLTLSKIKSRGRVLLKSSNPLDPPLIYPNYLTDRFNEDLKTLINTIDQVRKFFESPKLKDLNPEIVYLEVEPCKVFNVRSRDYWSCYFRHMASTAFHPVGTCKMGLVEDGTAVVDSALKVYGVQNLRVADASIMPVITNRNTQAAAYVIGEKAADLIKADNGFVN